MDSLDGFKKLIKKFVIKPDNLSLIIWTHIVEEPKSHHVTSTHIQWHS